MAGLLDDDDLVRLTGRRKKSLQILWLRGSGIPFRVSATGHPVVTWAAVNGQSQDRTEAPAAPARWVPRVVNGTAGA